MGEVLRERPLPVTELLLAAPAAGPGEPYGRRCLYRDDSGEVMLLGWRESCFCAPHDHGSARGWLKLLRGTFSERTWEFRDGEFHERSRRTLCAPSLVRVDCGDIHDMQATGGGVGVHLYVPPITRMNVFDRHRRQTLSVSDDCGAWIPSDPGLVRARRAWPALGTR